MYFVLAIGLSLVIGCKTDSDDMVTIAEAHENRASHSIPTELNHNVDDSIMGIPMELLDSKPKVYDDAPDISLKQSYQDTFQVYNPSELFAALGSDRVLMIQDGVYHLENRLLLNNYHHIKLQGVGKPTIKFVDPKLTSIMIYGSSSVWLTNLTLDIAYPALEVCRNDECMKRMLTMRKSSDIILDYIEMANTPLSAFNTDEVTNVLIFEMQIENSFGFNIDLYNSDNINIQNSSFKNLKTGDVAFSSYAPSLKSFQMYFDHVVIDYVTGESDDEQGPLLFNFNPVLRKCKVTNASSLSLGVSKEYIIDSEINL